MTQPIIPARKDDTSETFHGMVVADPYRWMEDADAEETRAFVRAQNARTAAFVAPQDAYIAAQVKTMEAAMDYARKSAPSHYGALWLRTYNPGLAPQPRYEIADAPTGPWRTLLDPLALDPSGVTSISDFKPTHDGKLLAYSTSVGGDDMVTLYIMDIATGQLLPDVIPHCRWPDVSWDVDNKGFHYSHTPGDDTKRRIVKYHRLGDDIANDKTVFMHDHPESIAHFERRRLSNIELVNVRIGTDRNNGYWYRETSDQPFVRLMEPIVETIQIVDLIDGWLYAISRKDAPRGQLVRFKPETPDARTVIVPEEPTAVLDAAWFRAGRLFLNYSDDTADRIDLRQTDGTKIGTMPLPPQSTVGFTHDNLEDNGCYVSIGGWLTAGTKYFYDYSKNSLELFEASDCPISLEDCVLERVRVTSKDGTQVPMTIIRHPSTVLDGTAALRLYGYGGFNVPLTPAFSPLRVANWVKEGGIFVMCNLRGGGEFGNDWYDAGRLHNKINTFDDMAACGQWLVDNKYTSAKRLVIEGGSNGGLVVLAVMHLYPQLFGAVISHVPVADMLRFDLHTFGAYWKSDYGDPKVDAGDFEVTMRYSPLHTIKPGALYPAHLVLTAEKDTRVVPMHSLKYVATMQAVADPKTPCYLRVEVDAGHGGGTALQKSIAESALILGFCRQTIGPINQDEYRRTRN